MTVYKIVFGVLAACGVTSMLGGVAIASFPVFCGGVALFWSNFFAVAVCDGFDKIAKKR